MMEAVSNSNRYPWEVTNQLREKIGSMYNLTKDHVTIGAGSSELLGVVSLMATLQKGNAVVPDPTFRLWVPAAKKTGLSIKLVPLTSGKITDLQRMKDSIDDNTKMLYICNPNNPTGTVLPAGELETFIKDISPRCIILLDEAYTEFSNEPSMAKLVNDYPNLIVAKTFSKIYGMAGARVGFALAHPQTIKQMNELQSWPNAGASACAVAAATATLDDTNFLTSTIAKNNVVKKLMYDFYKTNNIPYIESHANFVYYSMDKYKGDLSNELENRKILCGGINEEKGKWYRVTVGTENEMKQYIKAVGELIQG